MTTTTEVSCPKCGGAMWDNRATKTNPKAPDMKCKDRSCDGVIWPPKNGAPQRTAPVQQQKQAYSSGPALPYEAETGAPPAAYTVPTPGKLDALFSLYDVCFDHAHALAQRKLGNDASHEGVAAMSATLFIQASKP